MKISENLSIKSFLSFLLLILPTLILASLIIKYSVNVPLWDQWETPGYQLEKIVDGNLSLSDFWVQHNESRILFPKIIFILLAYIEGWNVQYEMIVTFVLACVISFNIYQLCNLTLTNHSNSTKLLLLFLTNCLIFSPLQWENWLLGITFIGFVPIVCITTNLVIIYSDKNLLTKLILCSILSSISTFSYANGLICWLITFAVVFVSLKKEINLRKIKNNLIYILIPTIIFVLNILVYFYSYQKPGGHPSLFKIFQEPITAIKYFLGFLGSPLGGFNLLASQAVAFSSLVIFVIALIYIIFYYQGQFSSLIPWLAIMSYSLISGTITTVGRFGFGVEQSLSSRYIGFSSYFLIGLIYTISIILEDIKHNNKVKLNYKLCTQIAYFIVGISFVLYLNSYHKSIKIMSQMRQERLFAKSCIVLINVIPQPNCIQERVFPVFNTVQRITNKLDQGNLFSINILDAQEQQTFLKPANDNTEKYGFFDSLEKDEQGIYHAWGWAILPQRKEKADVVILAYRTDQNSSYIPLGFTVVNINREDVGKAMNHKKYTQSGWNLPFTEANILSNSRPLEISAWAFDAQTGQAFQLEKTHLIY